MQSIWGACTVRGKKRYVVSLVISSNSKDKDHPGGPLSLKAGEAKVMIAFSISQLVKYGGVDRFGAPLLGALASLKKFTEELSKEHVIPMKKSMDVLWESYNNHLRCCVRAGIRLAPKHHLTIHSLARTKGVANNCLWCVVLASAIQIFALSSWRCRLPPNQANEESR